jgi:hypothetical protein
MGMQLLTRLLAKEEDVATMTLIEHLRQEAQAAKLALFETVQALTATTGALEKSLPHATSTIAAALRAAEGGEDVDEDDE